VLLGRIELPTSALPRMRSTTELQQHTISATLLSKAAASADPDRRALWRGGGSLSSKACRAGGQRAQVWVMTENKPPPKPATREERLAAKLRENLRLRKAQARALSEPPASKPADSQS